MLSKKLREKNLIGLVVDSSLLLVWIYDILFRY